MASIRVAFVDPSGASKALADGLSARGYDIVRPTTIEEVLKSMAPNPLDVIVLDPPLRGWDIAGLVHSLRSRPETAFVPVLFLAARTDIEVRIKGFQLGSDNFLPKPVSLPDLEARLSKAVSTRRSLEKSVRRPIPTGEFTVPQHLMQLRGLLNEIGLPTLLTLFDMERKTGMLVLIYDAPQEKVRLHFVSGRIVSGRIDGKETPRNAELIYALLERSGGKFDFRTCMVPPEDEVARPTSQLLLEGARLLDEHRRDTRQ